MFIEEKKLHPDNIMEILHQKTIEEMKFYYDQIIIDSAPIIPVSDPLFVANEVDGVALVIKAGEVTGKTKQILSLVQKLSKKILKDLNIKMTKAEEQILDKSQKLDMKAVVLFSKGIEFEDKNQRKKAIEFYNKALAIEPEFHQARMRIQKLTEEEKKS